MKERGGLLVSEVARRAGTTRKALRLYEEAGLLDSPKRTTAGYRLYSPDAVTRISFILQARRASFSLAEIRDIVSIRRSGKAPCGHIRSLLETKLAEIERGLKELRAARTELGQMLKSWRTVSPNGASVCPHIERMKLTKRTKVSR